jgi:hypothetical protein
VAVQVVPSLFCWTSVDCPVNPLDEKVQSTVSFADPAGLPLESLMWMAHVAWREQPLDVAGHDPWTPGSETSWSGPAPVIVTVPAPPAGVQVPGVDDTVDVSE